MTTQDGTLDLGPPPIRWRRFGVAAGRVVLGVVLILAWKIGSDVAGPLYVADPFRVLAIAGERDEQNLGARPFDSEHASERDAKASPFAKSSRRAGVNRSSGAVMCSLSSGDDSGENNNVENRLGVVPAF